MVDKFQQHIRINFSQIKNSKILVGVSAGVDSMVLVHLFRSADIDISIAHVNFNLRGEESKKDELFVSQLAKDSNITFYKTSFDTEKIASERKISIEMVARDLRYDWFQNLALQNGYKFIAVGHHLNDNIETILLNLSRGTGIDGISGMENFNGNIIRPLLPFSREEIKTYAIANGIIWHEDLSNKDTKYTRNKIRHELIPIFQQINPSFIKSFSKNISNFRQTQNIQKQFLKDVDYSFWEKKGDEILIDIDRLKKITSFETVLREKLLPYNFQNIDDILKGINAPSGKEYLSKTHRIIKDREKFILSKIKTNKHIEYFIHKHDKNISTPLKLEIETISNSQKKYVSESIALLDKQKLHYPLKLRTWQSGDYFFPLGMRGKKKLSKYYKDNKYSLVDKEQQWLLISGENIVWVLGKRIDERYKTTEKTSEILSIKIM